MMRDNFILKYIHGNIGKWQPHFSQKETFSKVLADFQTSADFIKFNWKSKLLHPLFSPAAQYLDWH